MLYPVQNYNDPKQFLGAIDTEKLLERCGVVGNGTSDDAAALQSAINTAAFSGKFVELLFPLGGLSYNIASDAGSGAVSSLTYIGLHIPANVSINFKGSILISSANFGAGDALIAIGGVPGATVPYGNMRGVLRNGKIQGNSNFDQLLFLGNPAANAGPAHATIRNMIFDTGANIVTSGSNSYNWCFDRCEFTGWSSSGYAITSFGGSTNWGENLLFRGCDFYNGAGGVLRNRGGFYVFEACSMDYVKQAVICDNAAKSQVTLLGCHLEQNSIDAKYAATQSMLEITAAATVAQIHMVGGRIIIATGSSGNNLDYVCDPGVTGAAAPYGIVLDRVYRSLNGVTLNNGAATGRFLDNQ